MSTVGAILLLALAGGSLVAAVLVRRWQARPIAEEQRDGLCAVSLWASQVRAGIDSAEDELRWITRDLCQEWEASRPGAPPVSRRRLAAEHLAAVDFLSVDLRTLCDATNGRILNRSLVDRKRFFDSIESKPLTPEQATAVVTMDNRVQVVAAAGSGKTSVMVARAAYAVRYEVARPHEVLLLAFNRAAAAELQTRVEDRLSAAGVDAASLTANTFHAFGLTVIGRATGRKPRLAGWLDGGQDVAVVSRIVDELRDGDRAFRFAWDMYRLLFARMSGDGVDAQPDAYDRNARVSGFGTMRGDVVKSEGERLIADWLFINGVDYRYEQPYVHDVADETHSQYRPDFFYPDIDVWHEHWALGRDGRPPAEFVGYAESMAWKKDTHRRYGTALVETTWAEIADTSGFDPLHDELAARGIDFDWNPDRVPANEAMTHEALAKLVRTFMAHVKSNGFTREDLEKRWEKAGRSYRSRVFLDLYWPIHDAWQARLRADDSIDFEDMLLEAAKHVEAGTDMGYRMVLVDEFQDASPARARLARALVNKPHRHLMTVGDDWQAINRFAGADISVMTDFNGWFGDGPTLRLQTTFRCTQTTADTAADFVQKNPRQLRKSVVAAGDDAGIPVELIRLQSEDEIEGAIEAWLRHLSERTPGASVDVLGRYGFEKKVMPRKTPSNLRVTFRTAHAAKGLEADYVLVPRMVSGMYGFPSEVVDDPVLGIVMSESDRFPHGEERRLFYVALTRARKRATLVTVRGRESAFVTELLKDGRLVESELSTAQPVVVCPTCGHGSLVPRSGPYGHFFGCSRFPACRHTQKAEAPV